jgi:hypothetical protein
MNNPVLECPRCNSGKLLLLKYQSTPYSMKVEPGPSIMLDLPQPEDEGVNEHNYTTYHVKCLSCGYVYTVKEMSKMTDELIEFGYIYSKEPK